MRHAHRDGQIPSASLPPNDESEATLPRERRVSDAPHASRLPRAVIGFVALLFTLLVIPGGARASSWWQPSGELTWQMQFSGRIDKSVKADAYDIDAFESSATVVAKLHGLGRHVVCYIDAGSWENFRPDANRYPASVKGRVMDGWPAERWLDIRQIDVLGPILDDRLAMCAAKGFDGVEFDNVDGYSNKTGFPLTAQDQLAFDRWLADTAHAHGLAVGLKNTPSLAKQLEPSFDFSIVEQCVQYRECTSFAPFLNAGKPVLDIEYSVKPSAFCPKTKPLGIFAMRKHLELDAWRKTC
jgi:hypothetical protein